MSDNPFQANATAKARHRALVAQCGDALTAEIRTRVDWSGSRLAENLGGMLPAADVAALMAQFNLESALELMLLAIGVAEDASRPPISGFTVGAVGLEEASGHMIFGGNVEFPSSHLGFSIHAEGFVFTRAFNRGTSISVIALNEAHPCGHCRQFLAEFDRDRSLQVIDPLGHTLSLADLYPWPFDPAYLGETGVSPGRIAWPDLDLQPDRVPAATAARLRQAGARAHAPYSKCPGAVVLELADGNLISGAAIESVAFNPGLGPLQVAFIDLLAHGYDVTAVRRAYLGTVRGGAVDYARSTAELLACTAPSAVLEICDWVMP